MVKFSPTKYKIKIDKIVQKNYCEQNMLGVSPSIIQPEQKINLQVMVNDRIIYAYYYRPYHKKVTEQNYKNMYKTFPPLILPGFSTQKVL